MSDEKYEVVAGPDGARDRYRFTILDANVVKDVERLFRVGLRDIKDGATLSRLRNLLRAAPKFGELYPGVGALELARPLTAAFDASKFSEYLVAVHSVANLAPAERLEAYKSGAPVREVRSQRGEGLEAGVELIKTLLPELLGDAAVLTRAWQLQASGIGWKSALSELVEFCNSEIRYAPGIAVSIAILRVAGSGRAAGDLTELVKNMDAVDATTRAESIMNAAGDLQFLSSLRRIPVTTMVANQESLSPTCGITADRGLIKFSRNLGYGSSTGDPSRIGSSIRLGANHFPEDRLEAVFATARQLNAGQAARRNTTIQRREDTRFSLFATSAFLDRQGDSQWVKLAAELDADPKSWWNGGQP